MRKTGATPFLCVLAILWAACGPLTPVSGNEFRLKNSDEEIRVTESGAIIIGKRQVGAVDKEGRVTTILLSIRNELWPSRPADEDVGEVEEAE